MEIDGERFESWPSSPNHPIDECFRRIDESDAVILLLGAKYGTPVLEKSGTHLEYDYVKQKQPSKPVFAFLLAATNREARQNEFIEIVFAKLFRCPAISDVEGLKCQVKNSLRQELVRRFRIFPEPPSAGDLRHLDKQVPQPPTRITLEATVAAAVLQIEALYDSEDYVAIHHLAEECHARFEMTPEIINLVYMAQVNLAMEGIDVGRETLLNAIKFWETGEAKKRWQRECLLYNQGNAFGALGLQDEAITHYKKALEADTSIAQCWVNLGNALSANGSPLDAMDCYEKALVIHPSLFEALYSSATISIRDNNNFERGLAFLNQIAIARLPARYQAGVHAWKANSLLKLHRYAEGIAEAENAIANAPGIAWTWSVAGRLYAMARQADKKWVGPAFDFWQRFVAKYPDNSAAWGELGYACWFLRNHRNRKALSKRALDAFEKSVFLGLVDDGLVFDRIGHLYQENQKWTEAEQAFRRAYQLDPNQFGYCFGFSLMRLNRYEEALPLLRAAVENHQPDALNWHNLGTCYERMGKTDGKYFASAETAYKKAIEIDPNYAKAWVDLGGLYWNRRNMEKAYEIWSVSLKKFPEHPECSRLRKFLSEVY